MNLIKYDVYYRIYLKNEFHEKKIQNTFRSSKAMPRVIQGHAAADAEINLYHLLASLARKSAPRASASTGLPAEGTG